jgi:hypothetical protein
MYTRVVRFTDVDAEHLERTLAEIGEAGGPPPGVSATGLAVLHDAGQRTAVVLQHFSTEADMNEAARIFDAMDASDTPGARASVDACELKLELEA